MTPAERDAALAEQAEKIAAALATLPPQPTELLQISGMPLAGGRLLTMLSPRAAELRAGDLIGGESWQEVASIHIENNDFGTIVELIVAPVDGSDLRTIQISGGVHLAVLRPEPHVAEGLAQPRNDVRASELSGGLL